MHLLLRVAAGFVLSSAIAVVGVMINPPANPDPNHTHADFAVWVGGSKLDFSGEEFMSGSSTEESTHDEDDERHHQHLHLHDGVGHVLHRHKPGLTLLDFLRSLGAEIRSMPGGQMCIRFPGMSDEDCEGPEHWYMLYVNSLENRMFLNDDYEFHDGDRLLITDSLDEAEARRQWDDMTGDACLYSKTCPWKGAPPAENCVADPTVPCVQ